MLTPAVFLCNMFDLPKRKALRTYATMHKNYADYYQHQKHKSYIVSTKLKGMQVLKSALYEIR